TPTTRRGDAAPRRESDMRRPALPAAACVAAAVLFQALAGGPPEKRYAGRLNVDPPSVKTDRSVKYDYDIVYVRTPRNVGRKMMFAEANHPVFMDAGGDLMLLKPDGTEEVLVKGGDGSVTDPVVSFDGQWVYYALFHKIKDLRASGSDLYKVHARTKKVVR